MNPLSKAGPSDRGAAGGGRIVLITGSTDGIGLETALQLARLGCEVVLHGRSESRLQSALELIRRAAPGASLHAVLADLSDLDAVAAIKQQLAGLPRLDTLVNNAGVYMNEFSLTRDGFEATLAVNFIAHFLLTLSLLPLLKKSPEPRVVTVSSIAHNSGSIDFANLNGEIHFDPYRAYANSKLAELLFSMELARRETWLASNSLHPGVIDTKLLHAGFDVPGDSVETGARTSVYLAASPEVAGISGKYFDKCAAAAVSPRAIDAELATALWRWSVAALGDRLES